jgi:hypothetical protein
MEEKIVVRKKESAGYRPSDLVKLGVMTALVITVQVAIVSVFHITGVAAIPGIMQFLTAFVSSVVLFIATRKIPKAGAFFIITMTYGIITSIFMGPYIGIGIIAGGGAGELVLKVFNGYTSKWAAVFALVVFRFVFSFGDIIQMTVTRVTEVDIIWYFITIRLAGSLAGAFAGALFGKSLYERLRKSGVVL